MYQFPLSQCQVVVFRGDVGNHNGIRAITTAGLQIPCAYTFSIPDNAETWMLRARNGSEPDDDSSIIRPNDFDASTNNVVWARIG